MDRELDARALPRIGSWFSTDWFVPDGIVGIAIPYYLASSELVRLERTTFGIAEDATERECLRFLRHEAGHAIDTAFRLARQKRFRDTFGLVSAPYRACYAADPLARGFVENLPRWYAQSHPKEDFAETFAVWLDPRSEWRAAYAADEAARAKLEAVDTWMHELAGERPRVATFVPVEEAHQLAGTVGALAEKRRRAREREEPEPFLVALDESFDRAGSKTRGQKDLAALAAPVLAGVGRSTGISTASIGMLWALVERRFGFEGFGPLAVSPAHARAVLEAGLTSTIHQLTSATWLLHR